MSAPVLPGSPIGAVTAAVPRSTADAAAEATRQSVTRSAYPAEVENFAAALERQELAEVEAAHAPPLDPEASPIDRWALAAVPELAARVERATSDHREAERACVEAERKRATLPKPMRWWCALLWVVATLALAALATYSVTQLLTGGVDLYLLRPHFLHTYGQAGVALSARYALLASFAIVGAIVFGQALPLLLTWGRIGLGWKLAFVAVEILFTATFAVLRLKDGASTEALAAGGFELAPLLTFSIFIMVAGKRLRDDSELRGPSRTAHAEVRAAERHVARAQLGREAAERALAAQVSVLEHRDLERRMLPARRELVAATTRAMYLTEVAALMSQFSDAPQEERFGAVVDADLEATYGYHKVAVKEAHDE